MNNNLDQIINNTLRVLHDGGTVLYPTETIWGIGCDATNENAIEKIYNIKKREQDKPLIILIHDVKLLKKYIQNVPEIAYKIIRDEIKPITVIYNNPINLPKTLIYKNTIGIRVVQNHEIKILLKKFNKPLTSTSANISNNKTPIKFSDIDEYIKNNVDYIVPINFIQSQQTTNPSSVIKIHNDGSIKMIRN